MFKSGCSYSSKYTILEVVRVASCSVDKTFSSVNLHYNYCYLKQVGIIGMSLKC